MTELEEASNDPMNNGTDRRVGALERWRDTIDQERGQIMAELGEIKGTLRAISDRLGGIEEKLDERPSRAEFKETERQIDSIRAKGFKISELEVTGPANMRFKLLGVSGVTIVLVFLLIVVIFALWFLRK